MATSSTHPAFPVPTADVMMPLLFRIDRTRRNTDDTFTIELLPKNASDGFSYLPGQFNMVYVFGVGEAPISISGDPVQAPRLVHTTRVVGTVTSAMNELKVGDTVGIRGPFGSNWPVHEAEGQDIVILTGGIGLAPLRPALYRVLAKRELYGNVVLLYGARTPNDILYRREIEQWRSRLDLEIHVTVDQATFDWKGNVGVVTTLINKVPFDPLNTTALLCGPEVMMRYGAAGLVKRGVAPSDIFVSLERNMKCAVGLCGHCQFGPLFVCKDGPVFSFDKVRSYLTTREI